jgi:hypothetical protein
MAYCHPTGMLSIGVMAPHFKFSTVTTGMISRPYCAIEPVKVASRMARAPTEN